MDSITIREIPPLCRVWSPIGQQVCVPIIGSHHKRVLSGVINILSGTYLPYVSPRFDQSDFQHILRMSRSLWRGWQMLLFVDKNSAHKALASQTLAEVLSIELRWLPTACPELNVMDCLWRHVRDDVLANEPTPKLDATVSRAIAYLDNLTPHQRLTKAGVLSENFWLKDVRSALLSS